MISDPATELVQRDIRLLERIADQDQDALMELYRHYGQLVYGMALRVLNNPGQAEEVSQDIFLRIWQKPKRWDPAIGRFSSWLLTVTHNAAVDRLRRERRTLSSSIDAGQEYVAGQNVQSVSADPIWVDGQILHELLDQLPLEQRQLIDLAFFGGYTHSELAQNLDLPLGTVKTRLRAGLQRLRTLWAEASRPNA